MAEQDDPIHLLIEAHRQEAQTGRPVDPSATLVQPGFAPALKAKSVPKTVGDPTVGGQDQTMRFQSGNESQRWQQLKGLQYPAGEAFQAAGGVGALLNPNSTPDKRMGGASDIVRGGGAIAAPFVLPEAGIAAPAKTAIQLALGSVMGHGTQQALKGSVLGPGAQNLASDTMGGIGALAGGNLGAIGKAARVVRHPIISLVEGLMKAKEAATGSPAPVRATTEPTFGPLENNTNSLKPAGTGKPPGPFTGNVPTRTNSGESPSSMKQAQAQQALEEFVKRTKAGQLGQFPEQGAPAMNVGPQGPLMQTNIAPAPSMEDVARMLQIFKQQ